MSRSFGLRFQSMSLIVYALIELSFQRLCHRVHFFEPSQFVVILFVYAVGLS